MVSRNPIGDTFKEPNRGEESNMIVDSVNTWPKKEAVAPVAGAPKQKSIIVNPGGMMIPSSTDEQLLVSKNGQPLVTIRNSLK